jgi:hypothetical protein
MYWFIARKTFEDAVHNKAIFRKQLASWVVDKKNPVASANGKWEVMSPLHCLSNLK